MTEKEENKSLLPHHEQKSLCTTRLPYRQGRKLTAVKVYTVNNESNHLLVFGVPSLNLRQETKSLFLKFGKVAQIHVTPQLTTEQFTDTYHVVYEQIQSARIAKRMLDTKTFYGGSLHVCYAPEYESLTETRLKILKRRNDVLFRLKKLQNEVISKKVDVEDDNLSTNNIDTVKMNMGDINTISFGKQIRDVVKSKKRKMNGKDKKAKYIKNHTDIDKDQPHCSKDEAKTIEVNHSLPVEVIDCTSTENETITNINIDGGLNYSNFGNEIVKKVPEKPVNRVQFVINNNKKV